MEKPADMLDAAAFVHVGQDERLPRAMVASVRRAMPNVRVLQLTDEQSPEVAGVHDVIRLAYDGTHLMTFRLMHFAQLDPCNVLFLDTDLIVQKDLSPLFAMPFDIALTRRDDEIPDPNGLDVSAIMPYNTGVMMSKSSGWDFWRNVLRQCEAFPEKYRKWWGDQLAVRTIAEVCPLSLQQLPCSVYNYTPSFEAEDVSRRFVVHYKGNRKSWMISRARAEYGLSL